MESRGISSYQCSMCDEPVFKSRSHWLVHLVLSPHSLKARKNFQEWKASTQGDIYVISDLAQVENSMLLEYISDNLRTFSDIVFFKPQANVCMIVCDSREGHDFSTKSHYVGGIPLVIKAYSGMSPLKWWSYFKEGSGASGVSGDDIPASSSIKRKRDDGQPTDQFAEVHNPSKLVKISHQPPPPPQQTQGSHFQVRPAPPVSVTHHHQQLQGKWLDELNTLQNFIFLPPEQINYRRRIVEELTVVLRKSFPKCELIPVGADFLGFNLESSLFSIFVDSKGFTQAENASPKCVISETAPEIDKIRTAVFVKLKTMQTDGILSHVQCQGANAICFLYVPFSIRCKVLLKPFMLAQNARLCKQLYSMSFQVTSLVNMIVYWAMQRDTFTDIGLCSPFIILWLVYFFLMTKNILPSVAELQSSCPFEIEDMRNNVAFPCDEGIFADVINQQKCSMENTLSQVELLLEWFQFMDNTLGETNGKGENRRHSLICPKFAELVDKRKFTVIWEEFRDKKKRLTSQQKQVRRLWRQNLIDIGFVQDMWGNLLGLKMPDTLCIQHPLYISENISLSFDGRFSKIFFDAVKATQESLTKLFSEEHSRTSLLKSLNPTYL